jgi:hypothetical protein
MGRSPSGVCYYGEVISTVRHTHSFWLPIIAIALVLSFVVHDFELTHEHPFAPYAHSHEQGQGHSHEQNDASVSVYTHGDRKDFLALLLLIAAVPVAQLLAAHTPLLNDTRRAARIRILAFDYHRLLFRKGILNTKRY